MKQRSILITGATGALGASVTRAALSRGALVTGSYILEEEADELRREHGEALRLIRCDVTDEDQVAELVGDLDRLEVLLHLVGGFAMAAAHAETLDGWRRQHQLNLTSAFLCCRAALGRMRQHGYGRIVTVGSRAVAEPASQLAAYASSKAGVVALTRVIAAETRGTDVTANCVLPSVIDTAANRAAMGSEQANSWVSPSRLAETICFLGSESAGDLRGAQVAVYASV